MDKSESLVECKILKEDSSNSGMFCSADTPAQIKPFWRTQTKNWSPGPTTFKLTLNFRLCKCTSRQVCSLLQHWKENLCAFLKQIWFRKDNGTKLKISICVDPEGWKTSCFRLIMKWWAIIDKDIYTVSSILWMQNLHCLWKIKGQQLFYSLNILIWVKIKQTFLSCTNLNLLYG